MSQIFVVTDEWLTVQGTDRSRLVGVYDTEEKAEGAIKRVIKHWETFDGGSQKNEHFIGYFEFDGPMNAVIIPEYEDAVGEDDDEDEDDDDDDEEDDDEDEDDDDD
jgi:phosphopantothenoylcysteine synthetase/decarboxylase